MHSAVTAIIHFRREDIPPAREIFDAMVGPLTGVEEVRLRPGQCYATVLFDTKKTTLAEIVRVLEDVGAVVTGIALRPGEMVRPGVAARFPDHAAAARKPAAAPRQVAETHAEKSAEKSPEKGAAIEPGSW